MIYAAAPPIMSTDLRVSSQVNGLKLLFLCVHVVLMSVVSVWGSAGSALALSGYLTLAAQQL